MMATAKSKYFKHFVIFIFGFHRVPYVVPQGSLELLGIFQFVRVPLGLFVFLVEFTLGFLRASQGSFGFLQVLSGSVRLFRVLLGSLLSSFWGLLGFLMKFLKVPQSSSGFHSSVRFLNVHQCFLQNSLWGSLGFLMGNYGSLGVPLDLIFYQYRGTECCLVLFLSFLL